MLDEVFQLGGTELTEEDLAHDLAEEDNGLEVEHGNAGRRLGDIDDGWV